MSTTQNHEPRVSPDAWAPQQQQQQPTPADNDGDTLMRDRPSVKDLLANPDVGPYHFVCQQPHKPSYPDVRENLLHVYNLHSIVSKVARYDSLGRKNKLRKSYKGFVAALPGRIDVVAKPTPLDGPLPMDDENNDRLLTYLALWPEDDWNAQNVVGKEMRIDVGKVQRAVAGLGRGDIPGFDPAVLGLEDDLQRKMMVMPQAVGVNGTAGEGAQGKDERREGMRNKKRRRYDDASFEGYEGYESPEPGGQLIQQQASVGGEAWDGEKRKKKRKKNPDVNSPGGMGMSRGREMPVQHSIYGR